MTTSKLSYEEYFEYERMIDECGTMAASITRDLCMFADERGFDRTETVDMISEMLWAIVEQIDLDSFDTQDTSHLN